MRVDHNMTPRQRSSLFSDLDFAFTQLDSAISLIKSGQFELAGGYLKSANHEAKILTNRLNKIKIK